MSVFGKRAPSGVVTPDRALPGRDTRPFELPERHAVLGTPLECPQGFPPDLVTISLAMGCFWGAERRMWRLPGVFTTAVGYQGGTTANPTYDEVCTGRTGHAEAVLVVFDPAQLGLFEVLRTFWENHDPTQGYRQGNDVGTQYRSAIYWTRPQDEDLVRRTAQAYQAVLTGHGLDPITTEFGPAGPGRPFYYAEPEHQQYLHKNPWGYDCHANTGYALPALG